MPWSETLPMDQRIQFIADFLREVLTVTELCDLYGVSRKTGYKWIERYLRSGPPGLAERSRKPRVSPNATPEEIVRAFLEVRRRHPSWGAKKLLTIVHQRHPRWELPGRSTVCDILSRHGMIPKKRNRRRIGHPGKPTSQILAPNDCWSADYKGQFKLGNGQYCYPLTVTDSVSRYLLGCQALDSTAVAQAKPVFTRLFKEFGLPKRIRTDNGVPFATNSLARLSSLSAGWVRLGVMPELIEPGKPQQNGRHERMHRTLKAEATRARRQAASAPNKRSSIAFARCSTMNDRMKRSISKPRPRCTDPHRGRCQTSSPRSNIPIASRCATFPPTAAFAGRAIGSTSRSSVPGNTWAWKRSMRGSGMFTAERSSSEDCSNGTCASRMSMAD